MGSRELPRFLKIGGSPTQQHLYPHPPRKCKGHATEKVQHHHSKRPLPGMSPIDVSKGLLNGDVELFPLHVPCIFEADVDRAVVE